MTYKFESQGLGGVGAKHCTYCPKRPGEACTLGCRAVYDTIQAERAAEGIIVVDEPPQT